VVVPIRQMEMASLAMVTTTSFWHGDMILLWGSKCGSKAGCGQGNGTAVVGGGVMPSAQTDRIRGPGVRTGPELGARSLVGTLDKLDVEIDLVKPTYHRWVLCALT